MTQSIDVLLDGRSLGIEVASIAPAAVDVSLSLPGPQGAKGDTGEAGAQGPAGPQGWISFAAHWDVSPAQVGTVETGAVYAYTLSGLTRYRLVPTAYDPALDAFYSTFSGGVLSGLIVSRG